VSAGGKETPVVYGDGSQHGRSKGAQAQTMGCRWRWALEGGSRVSVGWIWGYLVEGRSVRCGQWKCSASRTGASNSAISHHLGEEKRRSKRGNKQAGLIRDFSPNLTFTGRQMPLQSQRLVLFTSFPGPPISVIPPQAVLSTSIS